MSFVPQGTYYEYEVAVGQEPPTLTEGSADFSGAPKRLRRGIQAVGGSQSLGPPPRRLMVHCFQDDYECIKLKQGTTTLKLKHLFGSTSMFTSYTSRQYSADTKVTVKAGEGIITEYLDQHKDKPVSAFMPMFLINAVRGIRDALTRQKEALLGPYLEFVRSFEDPQLHIVNFNGMETITMDTAIKLAGFIGLLQQDLQRTGNTTSKIIVVLSQKSQHNVFLVNALTACGIETYKNLSGTALDPTSGNHTIDNTEGVSDNLLVQPEVEYAVKQYCELHGFAFSGQVAFKKNYSQSITDLQFQDAKTLHDRRYLVRYAAETTVEYTQQSLETPKEELKVCVLVHVHDPQRDEETANINIEWNLAVNRVPSARRGGEYILRPVQVFSEACKDRVVAIGPLVDSLSVNNGTVEHIVAAPASMSITLSSYDYGAMLYYMWGAKQRAISHTHGVYLMGLSNGCDIWEDHFGRSYECLALQHQWLTRPPSYVQMMHLLRATRMQSLPCNAQDTCRPFLDGFQGFASHSQSVVPKTASAFFPEGTRPSGQITKAITNEHAVNIVDPKKIKEYILWLLHNHGSGLTTRKSHGNLTAPLCVLVQLDDNMGSIGTPCTVKHYFRTTSAYELACKHAMTHLQRYARAYEEDANDTQALTYDPQMLAAYNATAAPMILKAITFDDMLTKFTVSGTKLRAFGETCGLVLHTQQLFLQTWEDAGDNFRDRQSRAEITASAKAACKALVTMKVA